MLKLSTGTEDGREHPALEHKLLDRTLEELDRSRRWMLLLGRKSASGWSNPGAGSNSACPSEP